MNSKRILVLIIASDNLPVYVELQKIWRSYMHLDRAHVEAYFIKGDPQLPTPYAICADTIWSKTEENLVPGIINKTLLSLEAMASRLDEFDYVLRTNLSSFYIFPQLLKFLDTLPKERCYCAFMLMGAPLNYGSGAGILLSRDISKLLVRQKEVLFRFNTTLPDDMLIGQFCLAADIDLLPAPRLDFPSIEDWEKKKDNIPKSTFHIRAKNRNDRLRATDEIYIQSELVKMFYNS